ncbi:hypothetical protein ACTGJ9_036370 [Bradyrhizobium sp. RDM12]
MAIYLVLVLGLAFGVFRLSLAGLLLYSSVVFLGVVSLQANGGPSAPSFFLLAVIYFPLAFVAKSQANENWRPFAIKKFCDYATLIAVIGGVQFVAQFAIHDDWLFASYKLIPEPIKASGVYNTVIEAAGGLKKSNGFFLREPSFMSMLCAIALLLEYFHYKRPIRLAILSGGMLVSLSGTGIIILVVGLFFPIRLNSLARAIVLGAVFTIFYVVVSEVLDLSIFTNRVAEFTTPKTSGYARFIAPYILLQRDIDFPPWAALLGHGPGSITAAALTLNSIGGSHDPTWAKSIYEYGLLGFIAILTYLLKALWSSWASPEFRVALLYAWLASGGQLLSPDFMAVIFICISLWPAMPKQLGAPSESHEVGVRYKGKSEH